MLLKSLAFFTFLSVVRCQLISLERDEVSLTVTDTDGILNLVLTQNGIEKLSAQIGFNVDISSLSQCIGVDDCLQFGDSRLHISTNIENGFTILWSTSNTETIFRDCFDLNDDDINWFGGPERYDQHWPIEKLTLEDFANVPQEANWSAVAEPYWLNSMGAYIFVDEKVPLFIDQNSYKSNAVCFIAKISDPYPSRTRVLLNYTIAAKDNAREAHLHAVQHFLGKPTGHPAYKVIERPIWSTWARYKTEINDSILLEFANEIVSRGFEDGQFEIDDYWEECYGSLRFGSAKFSDINNTVQTIKGMGFRVALWIHPFVNVDCYYSEIGRENGFFVQNQEGSILTRWWNSEPEEAQLVDFTNAEAREWFISRLKQLQENPGIDTFKFDAGETSWAPQVVKLYGDVETSPSMMTSDYVRACATFGDYVEVRSGWKTQDLPILIRMIDKDSRWGVNNGLYSLVTTLLQMNLNGYTMVLPDMIGGNGYNGELPSAELFIRWLQANTFMPSIQFSYVPWDYSDEEVEISRKFVDLHAAYADEIIQAMEKSISDGYPVNPPVWWIDPTNSEALKQDTEYLLGEDILVAPVLEEGAITRDVFLPSGTWIDGNSGDVYEGNQTLEDYNAPIEVLPYFLRQGSNAAKIYLNKMKNFSV